MINSKSIRIIVRIHYNRAMNTNTKLVVLDLDGTLLNIHGEVSDEGYAVLHALQQQGIHRLISSGRPFYSVQRIFKKPVYDYVSCMNGLEIYEASGKVIYSHDPLQAEEINTCMNLLQKYPMVMSFSDKEKFYHTCANWFYIPSILYSGVYALYHKVSGKPHYPHHLTPVVKIHLQTCEKLCFSSFHFVLKDFVSHLKQENYSYFFVNSKWLEVCPHGVSKGNALHILKQLLNIQDTEVVAIGDGENDLSMFEEAGTSVAMGNAMKKVKERADDSALSNLQDGAVDWLKKHLLTL